MDDFSSVAHIGVGGNFGGQFGAVAPAVVPIHFTGRVVAPLREFEDDGGGLGEDVVVGAFSFFSDDFRGQAEFEEAVAGVEDVGAPVAEGTAAIGKPGAPVARVEARMESGHGSSGDPRVPVEAIGEGLFLGHAVDFPAVPAAGGDHVGVDAVDVFDDTGLGPGAELVEVGFGVALVSDLCDDAVFFGGFHQEVGLKEGVGHGFFDIDVFAEGHGLHADGKVGVVRSADDDSINVVGLGVEHFAEVCVVGDTRIFVHEAGAVVSVEMDITSTDDLGFSLVAEPAADFAAAVADADDGEADF